jgi:Flp pilus assembly protein TadD
LRNSHQSKHRAARVEAAIKTAFERLRSGCVAPAATAAQKILAAHPRHHGALNLSALVCLEQNNATRAAALLEQAIALEPNDAIYHCNLGAAYRQAHRYPEAVAAARKATELQSIARNS